MGHDKSRHDKTLTKYGNPRRYMSKNTKQNKNNNTIIQDKTRQYNNRNKDKNNLKNTSKKKTQGK